MEDPNLDLGEDDFIFYSLLYTSITVLFAMAVLTKFLTNEFRFGFRSVLSLGVLFIGEPLCHMFVKGPSGVLIFGIGCFIVYSVLPASHYSGDNKAVLLTGCDTGFGNALAKKLDSSGMKVFAGCLHQNSPGATSLKNTCSDRLKVVQLDVTDDNQVQEAYEYISQQVGDTGLWGLVNNAGLYYLAETEMTSDKILHKTFEVNVFGAVRVTKKFIPLVRKAKGRIVNVSSITATAPFEGIGVYCMSKAALERFSDVLRMEMKKFGVRVSTIQPSGFKTASMDHDLLESRKAEVWKGMNEETKALYGRTYFDQIYETFKVNFNKSPSDVTPVIRAMKSALLSKRPLAKYGVGRGAWFCIYLIPLLPVWLSDYILHVLGATKVDVSPAELNR